MNLYQFLNRDGTFKRRIVLVNSLSGVLSIVVAFIIVRGADGVQPGEIQIQALLLFATFLVAYYFSRKYALVRISTHVERVINKTRKRIARKIQKTNLLNFERIGKEYFYTTLSTDSQIISQSSIQIINAAGSLAMVTAGSVALFIISPLVFIIAAAIFSLITLLYLRIRKTMKDHLRKISVKENEFFSALNDLLLGFKELKLNTAKSTEFLEQELYQLANEVFELKSGISKKISRAIILSQIYMYIILGSIVFALPVLSPDDTAIVAPASALLLFITGPLIEIVAIINVLVRTNNCIDNIIRIEDSLDEIGKNRHLFEQGEPGTAEPIDFNSLKCEGTTFSYHDENNGSSFQLGPVNFDLNRNEIVFIVGGNGSGKSTFLKMLTTLYRIDKGTIYLNGEKLTEENVTTYRNMFSPIFVDFHLFEKLYGQGEIDYDQVDDLLEEMALNKVTSVVNGRLGNRDLSTGQRKRLALVISILEDKPILIFDEVAADQDPYFRRYFYETIIPKLKANGKTILAVTHDDKYFSAADRVLKMEYGRISPFGADSANLL